MKTPGLNDALRSCARFTVEALIVVAAAIAAIGAYVYITVTGRNHWTD